ncbi:hypothetical protein IGI37_002712 [Enterococcus sp. AZ194]|uniref:hypothetical protein n=1 Tax=Enterococcus sp. AZ194 TaxID=2774629 RepID=UPI003F233553
MNQTQFVLLGFTLIGFFGSLSLFTPNLAWKDISILFRKDRKKEYIQFSNRYFGKVWLVTGCVSLILLIVSYLIKMNLQAYLVIVFYLLFLLIMRILLEISWNKQI